MGKPTGFLEYGRKSDPADAPYIRINNYREFHQSLDKKENRESCKIW